MTNRMQTQSDEFDAAAEFAKQYRRITLTAIVDDDYPSVRFDYERALAALLEAMKANGRFEKGNRYRVVSAEVLTATETWGKKFEKLTKELQELLRQRVKGIAAAQPDPTMRRLSKRAIELLESSAEAYHALAEDEDDHIQATALEMLVEWQKNPGEPQ